MVTVPEGDTHSLCAVSLQPAELAGEELGPPDHHPLPGPRGTEGQTRADAGPE